MDDEFFFIYPLIIHIKLHNFAFSDVELLLFNFVLLSRTKILLLIIEETENLDERYCEN